MAKRQKKDSVVEQAVLDAIGDDAPSRPRKRAVLTQFTCGHVGAEVGVKAKAFVRWAERRLHTVEIEDKKKCPECK